MKIGYKGCRVQGKLRTSNQNNLYVRVQTGKGREEGK